MTNPLLLVIDEVKLVIANEYEIMIKDITLTAKWLPDHFARHNGLISIDYLGYFQKQIDRSCQTRTHTAFMTILFSSWLIDLEQHINLRIAERKIEKRARNDLYIILLLRSCLKLHII